MRKIKFRQYVWEQDKAGPGRMIGWEELLAEHEEGLTCAFTTSFSNASPLMEYIGRSDMDGNEIYDGDIVISSDFGCGLLIVRYDGERAAFVATPITSCKCKHDRISGYALSRPKWGRVKKIGNIYENPELIRRDSDE